MSIRGNAELAELKQQMASMAPGVVESAAERVAPLATKLLGYAELVKAVLPQLQAAMARGARQAPPDVSEPPPPPPRAMRAVPARRGRSWRWRLLAVGLPVGAALAAYAGWRYGPRPVPRRGVPPG